MAPQQKNKLTTTRYCKAHHDKVSKPHHDKASKPHHDKVSAAAAAGHISSINTYQHQQHASAGLSVLCGCRVFGAIAETNGG